MRNYFQDKIIIKKIQRKIKDEPEIMDITLMEAADDCEIPENVLKSIEAMAIEIDPIKRLIIEIFRDYETAKDMTNHYNSVYEDKPNYRTAMSEMQKDMRFLMLVKEYDQHYAERVRLSQVKAMNALQYQERNMPEGITMPVSQTGAQIQQHTDPPPPDNQDTDDVLALQNAYDESDDEFEGDRKE